MLILYLPVYQSVIRLYSHPVYSLPYPVRCIVLILYLIISLPSQMYCVNSVFTSLPECDKTVLPSTVFTSLPSQMYCVNSVFTSLPECDKTVLPSSVFTSLPSQMYCVNSVFTSLPECDKTAPIQCIHFLTQSDVLC